MSRNSSGTYSLPAGNPVVTGTTITSTWANTTLSDIATALTDSLSRTGLGGMSAGLPLFDGTSSLPGLAWSNELTSGLYRAGAADFRWVNTTTELLQLTTNLLRISGTAPIFRINESDAAANNKLWDVIVSAEDMNFRVLTDALVATNWMTITRTAGTVDSIALAATAGSFSGVFSFTKSWVAQNPAILVTSAIPMIEFFETDAAADNARWRINANVEAFQLAAANDADSVGTVFMQVDRTGTTVDTVNFGNGVLQYGGNEVGYRNTVGGGTFSGSTSAGTTDRGGIFRYTGSGGHTLTFPNTVATNGIMSVVNEGSGTLTLAGSSVTLSWFNGSGTISTGSRTLAVGGVATVWYISSSAAYVWGTGIT